jgi:hypothetical protein
MKSLFHHITRSPEVPSEWQSNISLHLHYSIASNESPKSRRNRFQKIKKQHSIYSFILPERATHWRYIEWIDKIKVREPRFWRNCPTKAQPLRRIGGTNLQGRESWSASMVSKGPLSELCTSPSPSSASSTCTASARLSLPRPAEEEPPHAAAGGGTPRPSRAPLSSAIGIALSSREQPGGSRGRGVAWFLRSWPSGERRGLAARLYFGWHAGPGLSPKAG